MLKRLNHKENERLEVEFFEDKECTQDFDFTNAKDLYIDGLNGNVTPLIALDKICPTDRNLGITAWTPYLPQNIKIITDNLRIKTLNDITPNLSKYIPEDNILMFIGNIEELCKFNKIKTKYTTHHAWFCNEENKWIIPEPKQSNKLTIFLHHGTQSETEKAMEVSKYLWENFGIKPNLCALHWFYKNEDYDVISFLLYNKIFNKIITTNSTGILPVEDRERLQVIDCFNIFQDHLSNI